MPTNLFKTYNQLLEINHLAENERKTSLYNIFERDITNNLNFSFRAKIIRPIKKDGLPSLETLFAHLTCEQEISKDEKGKVIKHRTRFDFERSKRLHWIKFHIEEKDKNKIEVFSYIDHIKGKGDIVRTYIYDFIEKYVIVLEPQRSGTDYYLLSAYFLTKEKGGIKQIERKRKAKLDYIH